jgi:heat-inducible transcriptional repressor
VVPIETGKALILVVTNTGVAKNTMIKISDRITPDTVIRVSNIVNEKLTGLTVEQINLPLIRDLEVQLGMSRDMVLPILNGIADCIGKIDKSEVFLDGANNIFNYPEFRDIDKAKEFLDILEEKDIIHSLLKSASLKDSDAGLIIQIGRENEIPEINGCTLLTTTYSVGDKVIGSIGVIGPTRMEYSRVIASMNFIKKRMNEEIYKIIGESLNGS